MFENDSKCQSEFRQPTDLRHFEPAPGLYPRSAALAIGVTDCPSRAEAANGPRNSVTKMACCFFMNVSVRWT
jgi:hypothetical protein